MCLQNTLNGRTYPIMKPMKNKSEKNQWIKPEVKKLGNAKKITKNTNVVGGGDIEFSVINPS